MKLYCDPAERFAVHPIIDVPLGVAIDQDLQWLIMRMQSVCLSKVSTEHTGDCSVLFVYVLGSRLAEWSRIDLILSVLWIIYRCPEYTH